MKTKLFFILLITVSSIFAEGVIKHSTCFALVFGANDNYKTGKYLIMAELEDRNYDPFAPGCLSGYQMSINHIFVKYDTKLNSDSCEVSVKFQVYDGLDGFNYKYRTLYELSNSTNELSADNGTCKKAFIGLDLSMIPLCEKYQQ